MARPSAAADIEQGRTTLVFAAKKMTVSRYVRVSARRIYKAMPDQVELNRVSWVFLSQSLWGHSLLLSLVLKLGGHRRGNQSRRSSRSRRWSRSAQTLFASWAVLGQLGSMGVLVGEAIQPSVAQAQINTIPGTGDSSPNTSAGVVSGTGAFAIGLDASADGSRAFAIGEGAKASGTYAVAIGRSSNASAPGSGEGCALAIGYSAQALGKQSIAIGASAMADATQTIAIGCSATATKR